MGFCSNCGTYMADKEYGKCSSCSAAAHASEDVPCQRCGMYLPSHELQMWNSRYYCQYCIMDIRDEERRFERRVQREEQIERIERPERDSMQQYPSGEPCQRCGKMASTLYDFGGRRLCLQCLQEEGGKPPSAADTFGAMVGVMREVGEKGVKVVEKARKMGEKIREARERAEGGGDARNKGRERTLAGRAKEMLGLGGSGGKADAGAGGEGASGKGNETGGGGTAATGEGGGSAMRSFDIKTRSYIRKEHGKEVREVAKGAESGIEFDPDTRQFVERKKGKKEKKDETMAQAKEPGANEAPQAQSRESGGSAQSTGTNLQEKGGSQASEETGERKVPHEQFAHRKMPHDEAKVVGALSKFQLLRKKLQKQKGEEGKEK